MLDFFFFFLHYQVLKWEFWSLNGALCCFILKLSWKNAELKTTLGPQSVNKHWLYWPSHWSYWPSHWSY